MARKVFVWLLDEEVERYEQMCEELGVDYTQLATVVVCKFLGVDVPPSKKTKKFGAWIESHKLRTQAEFKERGSGTTNRLEGIMADGRAWTVRELASALGWKNPGGLSEILKWSSKFEETDVPEDWPRQRGARPKFWRLRTSD